jgi:integrase
MTPAVYQKRDTAIGQFVSQRRKPWEPGPSVSEDQARDIVAAAESERDRLLIATLFATGVRVGELIQLRPVDLVDSKTIRFRLEKNRRREWNDVVLWPEDRELIAQLHAYARQQELLNNDYIFAGRLSWKHITRQRVGIIFSDCARRAGVYVFEKGKSIPAHPHTARHSRTRWDLSRGMPLPAIQRQRGWSNLASGQPYLEPNREQVIGIMERLPR